MSTKGFGWECVPFQFTFLCVYQGLDHVVVCVHPMATCVILVEHCGADGIWVACGNIHVYRVFAGRWAFGVVCARWSMCVSCFTSRCCRGHRCGWRRLVLEDAWCIVCVRR